MWWRGLGLHIAALRHDVDGGPPPRRRVDRDRRGARRRRPAARARPRAGDAARRHAAPTRCRSCSTGSRSGSATAPPRTTRTGCSPARQLLEARGDHEAALARLRGGDRAAPATRCGPPRSAPRTSARAGASSRSAGSTRPRSTRRSRPSCSPAGAAPGSRSSPCCSAGSAAARRSRARPSSRRAKREVVALLAEGLTNGEIATRLFISPKTASVHVSNILAKLSMTSRAEIAAYAVRAGLDT